MNKNLSKKLGTLVLTTMLLMSNSQISYAVSKTPKEIQEVKEVKHKEFIEVIKNETKGEIKIYPEKVVHRNKIWEITFDDDDIDRDSLKLTGGGLFYGTTKNSLIRVIDEEGNDVNISLLFLGNTIHILIPEDYKVGKSYALIIDKNVQGLKDEKELKKSICTIFTIDNKLDEYIAETYHILGEGDLQEDWIDIKFPKDINNLVDKGLWEDKTTVNSVDKIGLTMKQVLEIYTKAESKEGDIISNAKSMGLMTNVEPNYEKEIMMRDLIIVSKNYLDYKNEKMPSKSQYEKYSVNLKGLASIYKLEELMKDSLILNYKGILDSDRLGADKYIYYSSTRNYNLSIINKTIFKEFRTDNTPKIRKELYYKINPDLPQRLYQYDNSFGWIFNKGAVNTGYNKQYVYYEGKAEAQERAEYVKEYMEKRYNIDYRNIDNYKDQLKVFYMETSEWYGMDAEQFIDRMISDIKKEHVVMEAKFITDESLVYKQGDLVRTRGTLEFNVVSGESGDFINSVLGFNGTKKNTTYQCDFDIAMSSKVGRAAKWIFNNYTIDRDTRVSNIMEVK